MKFKIIFNSIQEYDILIIRGVQFIMNQNNISMTDNLNTVKDNNKMKKILMVVALITALIISLDNFIISMDWFSNLKLEAIIVGQEELVQSLNAFSDLILVFNWTLVVIVTILSIIFLIIDKRKRKSISLYVWYIIAGLFHILEGIFWLTSLIYAFATLNTALVSRKNSKSKINNIFIIFSILLIIILIIFIVFQL